MADPQRESHAVFPTREAQLEEYKEVLAYMRHDDTQAWTILGLSGTVALGLWAYTFKDAPLWSIKALVLALLGVVAVVLGRLMARRITSHTESRRLRAIELEKDLGFKLFREFDSRRPEMKFAPSINRTLNTVAWAALVGWVVYFGLAVWMRTQ